MMDIYRNQSRADKPNYFNWTVITHFFNVFWVMYQVFYQIQYC